MEANEYFEGTNYLDQMRLRSEQAAPVREAEDVLGITEVRQAQERVSSDMMRSQHVKLYGEVPSLGNPALDALARMGCPCIQCFRSDFL